MDKSEQDAIKFEKKLQESVVHQYPRSCDVDVDIRQTARNVFIKMAVDQVDKEIKEYLGEDQDGQKIYV